MARRTKSTAEEDRSVEQKLAEHEAAIARLLAQQKAPTSPDQFLPIRAPEPDPLSQQIAARQEEKRRAWAAKLEAERIARAEAYEADRPRRERVEKQLDTIDKRISVKRAELAALESERGALRRTL